MPRKKKYIRKSHIGSIRFVEGRTKPYRATATVNGKLHDFGYFMTEEEADEVLLEFELNPDGFKKNKMLKDVYAEWLKTRINEEIIKRRRKGDRDVEEYDILHSSTFKNYDAAFKSISEIHRLPFSDITIKIAESEIRKKNPPMQKKARSLLIMLCKYAVRENITTGSQLQELNLIRVEEIDVSLKHFPFSQEEIDILWQNSEDRYVQFILMGIYSGVRPGELLNLKKKDVHLDEDYFFIQKGKNENSVRAVPIHKRVKPFYREWLNSNEDSEHLINKLDGKKFSTAADYNTFLISYWNKALRSLGILEYTRLDGVKCQHKPHDIRTTFATRWAEQGLNPIYGDKIKGHSTGKISIDVYTKPFLQSLLKELNKLK